MGSTALDDGKTIKNFELFYYTYFTTVSIFINMSLNLIMQYTLGVRAPLPSINPAYASDQRHSYCMLTGFHILCILEAFTFMYLPIIQNVFFSISALNSVSVK